MRALSVLFCLVLCGCAQTVTLLVRIPMGPEVTPPSSCTQCYYFEAYNAGDNTWRCLCEMKR